MGTFQPTDSKTFFVGRDRERQEFHEVVVGERHQWIISVVAPGGAGKTKLLEHYRGTAYGLERFVITDPLIDFYNTSNQTNFGLLNEIARQLGKDHFPRFLEELVAFQDLLRSAPRPAQRQEAFNWVNTLFFREYAALLGKGYNVLLLLDTIEEMHGVQEYVMNTLLREIARVERQLAEEQRDEEEGLPPFRTTVVMAGRKHLDFPPDLREDVLLQEPGVLIEDDMRGFFPAGSLTDEQLTRLYHRTGGRPLYVALSYDWLKNEVGTVEELLTLEPLEEELIRWIHRLPILQKQVILYTSLAWRRMEPGLLAHLLEVPEAEAEEIIQGLIEYSFIKYRRPGEQLPGALQLHDEMRDLVNEYAWPQEGRLTLEALLPQIIQWYEQRIGDEALLNGEKLPPTNEDRALLAEYLFYLCQHDLDHATEVYEMLFRNAVHYLDLAFCDLLNREVRRFQDELAPAALDELRFREALVAFRAEEYKRAEDKWQSLVRRPELAPKTRATTLMLLVELKSYTGSGLEALAYAEEAEKLYQELIEESQDEAERDRWRRELQQLYNNWGFAHRVVGNLAKAREYYERVLAKPHLGTDKNTARTLNNVGYVYFLEGDLVQARTRVGLALKLRSRLEIPYELGLGYNTMGIIMEESGRPDDATDLYAKALLNFQNARSRRGAALVRINLGRIWRVNNAYDNAIRELEEAHAVFSQYNDTDNLMTTLNELGCVYRQRAEEGDFELAERYLTESMEMSREPLRPHRLTDNLEDLAILYQRWYVRAELADKGELAAELDAKARDALAQVQHLVDEHDLIYFEAKRQRTLGDLEFVQKNYDAAFEHYMAACQDMARAKGQGQRPQIQLQRRFEEMVDRLQEQLHALPNAEMTFKYADWVLEKLDSFADDEQQELQAVRDFVTATLEIGRNTLVPASDTPPGGLL